MRRTDLTREDFLRWIGNLDGDQAPALPADISRSGAGITLIWPDDQIEGRPIVAIDASEIREFLAFVATYVATYVPFTAFFRVVPRQMADLLPRFLKLYSAKQVQPLMGALICDAISQLGSTKVADIPLQACLATPSAVAVRAFLLGYDSDLSLIALQRWFSVREEISPAGMRAIPEQYLQFWATVLSALGDERPATYSVNQPAATFLSSVLHGNGMATGGQWDAISHLVGGSSDVAAHLRGNREDRVRILDQFVSRASTDPSTLAVTEMIVGYIAAQVAEGSLNYISLAQQVAVRFPLSLLWFGLFSGMNRSSDIFSAGDCLGRRLVRSLEPTEPSLGQITADLSYEEFSLYLREARIDKVRTSYQAVMEVELIPGVSGRFRKNAPRPNEDARRTSVELRTTGDLEHIKKLLAELNTAVRDLQTEPPRAAGWSLFGKTISESVPSSKQRTGRKKNYK